MDPISIKLDDDNYSAWKAEALGKIKESSLEKFITMKDFGGQPPMLSEEYKSWIEQDQVLYTWLLDSLHPKLLHRIERCECALEFWKVIEVYFLNLEIEEIRQQYKRNLEETAMVQLMRMNLDAECPETSNEDMAIEEELGPESAAADILLSLKPGTS
ncbi:hypothetical protein AAZX31_20G006900 [Glycine max]|uniref:Retrotransposon Copia-like N-terminal domain-containing protein n=2 Tax=Glycine subgen. Soja TaxID=1462606 RepID=K7N0M2_SOYBN|nr:hypothetical protein JHK86_054699 [Glycine max]KHM99022.1 hypothetical protein glysoja_024322 [Glycine soja]KAG4917377.1 hypothetical protein JHK85_055658 [Glycine max]KAG5076154.1 hypothetical protein JHK82_054849 [Glycine max]KAH1033961.1 hypothetical protein GYH30_054388 [Glycine max]|eukprot:XP_025983076.1 uncharacterized protein LOC113000686 [Glycine max]